MEAFAAEMRGSLARRDQQAKGELYVRSLMLDGKRKSMQPMAERLGVDHHQQLQQFISSSTWDYVEVRRRVARWAAAHLAPEAYAIDDSGFPKDGYDSLGVARMYCGALGKRGTCQIGVSVNLASDRASAAVDWRLFIYRRCRSAALPYTCARQTHDRAAELDRPAIDTEDCGARISCCSMDSIPASGVVTLLRV
ncbi:transposase [Streptomyces sp. NPDC059862]|uniref:IS701 family transposase n=1 Tax=Streptomyces sp. NPDC059862 TaxID=3346975 RepID=UPI003665D37B